MYCFLSCSLDSGLCVKGWKLSLACFSFLYSYICCFLSCFLDSGLCVDAWKLSLARFCFLYSFMYCFLFCSLDLELCVEDCKRLYFFFFVPQTQDSLYMAGNSHSLVFVSCILSFNTYFFLFSFLDSGQCTEG